jgi:nitroimidazol reductase NimA-like FMN-containing flavoprotein (pyridoxamine 5'-phosphate oxidase superfamily)
MPEVPAQVPEQFAQFLAEPRTGILSVARGAGRPPHATPVWFHYTGARFEVSITRNRTKFRFIQRASAVSLVIDDPMAWRTVIIEGSATVLDDDASLLATPMTPDDEILRGLRAEERVVIAIEPAKVISWAR